MTRCKHWGPLRAVFGLAALAVGLVLLVFNLRRLLLTLAIFLPPRTRQAPAPAAYLPDILVLVPCRNEAEMIAGMCAHLEQIDYPRAHLRIALVDDGSTDDTRARMLDCTQGRAEWRVVGLDQNAGKAAALNAALRLEHFGDILYVLDADHRPEPGALRRLAAYFDDPNVAGVSGRTQPLNGLASPSAYYATVEGDVHQMLTMRAKDRLDLAPALLGSNCAYRRAALEAVGAFRPGALLEDSDITLAFVLRGYRLRFAPDVRAFHQVPESVDGYLRQHMRWGRGFNEVARSYLPALARAGHLPPALRAELLLFSAGYLDRLALLGAGGLSGLALLLPGLVPGAALLRALLAVTLALPVGQIAALFTQQRAARAMWARLPLVPLFFGLDIFAALRAMLATLARRPQHWERTARIQTDK